MLVVCAVCVSGCLEATFKTTTVTLTLMSCDPRDTRSAATESNRWKLERRSFEKCKNVCLCVCVCVCGWRKSKEEINFHRSAKAGGRGGGKKKKNNKKNARQSNARIRSHQKHDCELVSTAIAVNISI